MTMDGLNAFLDAWSCDSNKTKTLFATMYDILLFLGAEISYKARPGVSHSLRARHPAQKRELFVLVDVIDDNPDNRWLSVCFYADLVSDREGRGDRAPGGIMNEDACCFDVDENAEEMTPYLSALLKEAFDRAGKED
jgi:hypothetical protein